MLSSAGPPRVLVRVLRFPLFESDTHSACPSMRYQLDDIDQTYSVLRMGKIQATLAVLADECCSDGQPRLRFSILVPSQLFRDAYHLYFP